MDYTATIEFKETYLHVKVTGKNTLENVLGYFNEIYEACLRHQCKRVLIEETLVGQNLDTFEIFEVIIKNFNKAKSIGARLAYVDLNTAHNKRGLRFAENLAHIRGVNVEVFFAVDEAIRWLLDEGTKQ